MHDDKRSQMTNAAKSACVYNNRCMLCELIGPGAAAGVGRASETDVNISSVFYFLHGFWVARVSSSTSDCKLSFSVYVRAIFILHILQNFQFCIK